MVQFGRILQTRQRLLTTPWTYVATAVVAVAAATSMVLGGVAGSCSESQGQLASRLSELEKTYAATYGEASADMQACQSLDCERPVKLEVAASLRSYNQGLGHICWPTRNQSRVNELIAANSAEATAYNSWADATTPADDQAYAIDAAQSVAGQQAASQRLANQLH